jgi:hypothetical protein
MRLLLGALAVMAACRAEAASRQPSGPKLPPGAFRIAESNPTAAGGTRWVARAGDRCAFEIEVAKPQAVGGSPFAMTTVALVRRREADCASFLRDLALALGFKGKMPAPRPIPKLEVAAVVLGTNQTRSPADLGKEGAFTPSPPGHWMVTKLFLADGEGEVFLDLNADEKLGELSLKDEDAAEEVVSELARLLLPDKP